MNDAAAHEADGMEPPSHHANTPVKATAPAKPAASAKPRNPYLRAANEDDDGYDPYSDRRPEPEPLFERDPWR